MSLKPGPNEDRQRPSMSFQESWPLCDSLLLADPHSAFKGRAASMAAAVTTSEEAIP